jgi:hypothetical protein
MQKVKSVWVNNFAKLLMNHIADKVISSQNYSILIKTPDFGTLFCSFVLIAQRKRMTLDVIFHYLGFTLFIRVVAPGVYRAHCNGLVASEQSSIHLQLILVIGLLHCFLFL